MDFAVFDRHLYYKSVIKLKAKNLKETKELFEKIESLRHKYYFLGYLSYEFYKILGDCSYQSDEDLVYFEGFAKKKRFKNHSKARYYPKLSKLDFMQYQKAFMAVKEAIAKGQSYQVNITQELFLQTQLSGFELFKVLTKEQNTRYKLYLKSDDKEILSFSPELFFATKKHKKAIQILTKPMKGTIQKGRNKQESKHNAKILQQDIKNRSENVMIVDLLRNDLAHIAKAKSIKVSKLFSIESYKTLLQMTSSIKGTLRKNVRLLEIFKALFPCGSITGAPKIETMKLIRELEQRDRGVYCGALGLIHKDTSIFSVGIRTLCKRIDNRISQRAREKTGKETEEGIRDVAKEEVERRADKRDNVFSYGVGSGVVWDSVLEEEFRELALKGSFLQGKQTEFYLFETMYCVQDRVLFFKEHLERIITSARHFGFRYENLSQSFARVLEAKREYGLSGDLSEINTRLFSGDYGFFDVCVLENCKIKSAFCEVLQNPQNNLSKNAHILRLRLYRDGVYDFEVLPLLPPTNQALRVSEIPSIKDDFIYHKTSYNPLYAKKSAWWKEGRCFDVAFFNAQGELCEGTRSNIIVQKDGRYYTPSLECGLLAGIYRQFLLQIGAIHECVLSLEDLQKASRIYCLNSVRGLVRVELE